MEGRPPKIWEGQKNVQNSVRFLTTFDFDREYLRNHSTYPKSKRNVFDSDSSRVPRKKSGELWSTNRKFYWLELSHPSGFFGETIFQPLGGCCALKFIHALEIAQALIAHTRRGTGVPPKNSNRENLKFGLKFSVCTPITSGPVRVSPQNIFHTTCRQAGVITWV